VKPKIGVLIVFEGRPLTDRCWIGPDRRLLPGVPAGAGGARIDRKPDRPVRRGIADLVRQLVPSANIVYTGEVGDDPRNLLPEFRLNYNLAAGMEELLAQFYTTGSRRLTSTATNSSASAPCATASTGCRCRRNQGSDGAVVDGRTWWFAGRINTNAAMCLRMRPPNLSGGPCL
jgi:hypothetical protein